MTHREPHPLFRPLRERRRLEPYERALIEFILEGEGADFATYRLQIACAMVVGTCACGACRTIDLVMDSSNGERSTNRSDGLIADAVVKDRDGMPVFEALLHGKDGYLIELEIIKADGTEVTNVPLISAWERW